VLVCEGFYDSTDSPCVHFHLGGAFNRSTQQLGFCYHAVIDTGFNGFMSMPMKKAFPLALPFNGITKSRLADGSWHERFKVLGRAIVADKSRWGEIILEPDSDEFLIRIEFLQMFDFALVITRSRILLFDDTVEWSNDLPGLKIAPGVREPPPGMYSRATSRSRQQWAARPLPTVVIRQ